MSVKSRSRRKRGPQSHAIHKPRGVVHPRVVAVGPASNPKIMKRDTIRATIDITSLQGRDGERVPGSILRRNSPKGRIHWRKNPVMNLSAGDGAAICRTSLVNRNLFSFKD